LEKELPCGVDGQPSAVVVEYRKVLAAKVAEKAQARPVIEQLKSAEDAVGKAQRAIDDAERRRLKLLAEIEGIDHSMQGLTDAKSAAEAVRNEVQLRYNASLASLPQVGAETLRGARQATDALETIFRNALAAAASGKLTDPAAVTKQFEDSVKDIKAGLPSEASCVESLPALEAAAAALTVGGSKRALDGGNDVGMGGVEVAAPSGNG